MKKLLPFKQNENEEKTNQTKISFNESDLIKLIICRIFVTFTMTCEINIYMIQN